MTEDYYAGNRETRAKRKYTLFTFRGNFGQTRVYRVLCLVLPHAITPIPVTDTKHWSQRIC